MKSETQDAAPDEQQTFAEHAATVEEKVKDILNSVLGSAVYDTARVPDWANEISTQVLKNLQEVTDTFKYVVSVMVLQRSNGGFHLFSSCYWDHSVDGTVTVRWENKSMHVVVTVFGLAY